MKTAQDRYFECLEVCIEDEQGKSCRQVCAPILNDDPLDHPTVPLMKNQQIFIFNNYRFEYFNLLVSTKEVNILDYKTFIFKSFYLAIRGHFIDWKFYFTF